LAENDILLTITGRVGNAAVVPRHILPANINQHLVRLRIVRDDCLPEYIAAYLNSSFGLSLTNRYVTGGTRIALDYGAIRSLLIPIPPVDLQKRIIEELQRRKEEAHGLREEAETEWEAAKRWFEEQLLGPAAS
jgi:restriction endonuclease S subunit